MSRAGRRLLVSCVLVVHALAGPLAMRSHDHSGDDACYGRGPAVAVQAVEGRSAAPLQPHATVKSCCRFRSCRGAGTAAGGAADRGSIPTSPVVAASARVAAAAHCLACGFLAQCIGVMSPAAREQGVHAAWPDPSFSGGTWVPPIAAAFLARGPPA